MSLKGEKCAKVSNLLVNLINRENQKFKGALDYMIL